MCQITLSLLSKNNNNILIKKKITVQKKIYHLYFHISNQLLEALQLQRIFLEDGLAYPYSQHVMDINT